MRTAILAPRGTQDLIGKRAYLWHKIKETIRSVVELYSMQEIITPTFEHTELFTRSVGESTDVVSKEMYTFNDKGGRSITLRPEGTAGVVRACVEHGLFQELMPLRLFYFANCFRYDRPQAGRFRELNQFGVEIFGSSSFRTDVQTIEMALKVLEKFGLRNQVALAINSIGCKECRATYQQALLRYLSSNQESFCKTCQGRIEQNPLRVLDCKEEACGNLNAEAPSILEFLCADCCAHFEGLKRGLETLEIEYRIDHKLVRGLDYYSRTVFELEMPKPEGGAIAVCGGGRYDSLVESLGGPATPAFGFGMGLERLMLLLAEHGIEPPKPRTTDVFIVGFDENNKEEEELIHFLLSGLQKKGIIAQCDVMQRTIKSQFKYADKVGARFSVVVGEEERKSKILTLKDLRSSTEVKVAQTEVIDYLVKALSL